METAAVNYKLIKKIGDERFDVDLIHRYHLLIQIGQRDLQVGVLDPVEARMLYLEDYVFPSLNTHSERIELLEDLFDAHAFLKAAFWKKIKIAVKNNKFIQVPDALFVEGAESDYLKFNARVNSDEEILSVTNAGSKAKTVFAVQSDLKQWLMNLYPDKKLDFMHQSAALIEGITQFSEGKTENPLCIFVDRFKLHILSCKEGRLFYYNQFIIKAFSDYIKYMMLVMKSLNLSQSTCRVLLWGYVGQNSPHDQEFRRYISNINFGHRPKYLSFGYVFDEIQDHHFFDLYSMHLVGA